MNFMYAVKDRFIESIKTNITDDSQQAILLALLIGYTSELNDDIRQSFTETGIMHLLAVSGMHVGIIFLVLNFMFKGLLKLRKGNIIFIIVVSLMLWIYAGITGFSPSVLRATIMFNFLLIGKNIRKVNFVYNSILVSAFLLLLFEPMLLFHVGFQLSYAAVIGIVFVQPYLNSLLTTRSWIVKTLWPLISVTLSAQFFTLPLILYYFSQFPVYFFLANLLIIPISTLVIYLGFVMVLFDVLGVHSLTWFFALIDSYTMEIMNRIIFYIRQLPFVLIDNIYLSPLMAIILFILITYLCFWIFYKKKSSFFLFSASLVVFILVTTIWNFQNYKKHKLVIYAIPGQTLISYQDRKEGMYIGDSAIIFDTRQLRLYTYRNLIASGISFHNSPRCRIGSKIHTAGVFADGRVICANSTRLLFINHLYSQPQIKGKIKFDYIILGHNPGIKFDELIQSFDFKTVVFDASNSPWKIKQWKAECNKYAIRFKDINETGAMIIDI
jgi:competence protein ComEC